MDRKILFLDIDGVLNDHTMMPEANCCGIGREKMSLLNDILKRTECRLVLISAWRYLILTEVMNLDGFYNLMRTHGMRHQEVNPFLDYLEEDRKDKDYFRAKMVQKWLQRQFQKPTYCIIDDLDLGYFALGLTHVQPDSGKGLQREEAELVIKILGEVT